MSDQFKEFEEAPAPVLTFGDPVQEEPQPQAEEKPAEPQLDESILTEEERKMVDDFSRQIDLRNSTESSSTEWEPRRRWRISLRMP